MQLLKEKTGDLGPKRHIPLIEMRDNGVKIKVGSVSYPMDGKLYRNGFGWGVYRKVLKPGGKPEVEFDIKFRKYRWDKCQRILLYSWVMEISLKKF